MSDEYSCPDCGSTSMSVFDDEYDTRYDCESCGGVWKSKAEYDLAHNAAHTSTTIAALRAQLAAAQERERVLSEALHHIGYQKPASDVSLDWHEEWQSLRSEARAALAQGEGR